MSTVSARELREVEIIIDGSCLGNPGPGGWACILRCGEHERVLQGGVPDTTNNRMELAAAIEGLKVLKRACQVTVLADSDYVRRGITEFLPRWKSNGWQNSCGKRVVNQDVWEQLEQLVGYHAMTWYTFEGTPANSITNAVTRWRHRSRGQPGGQPRLPDWRTKSDGDRKPVVWAVDTGKPVRRAAQSTGRLVGGRRRQKGDVPYLYI